MLPTDLVPDSFPLFRLSASVVAFYWPLPLVCLLIPLHEFLRIFPRQMALSAPFTSLFIPLPATRIRTCPAFFSSFRFVYLFFFYSYLYEESEELSFYYVFLSSFRYPTSLLQFGAFPVLCLSRPLWILGQGALVLSAFLFCFLRLWSPSGSV